LVDDPQLADDPQFCDISVLGRGRLAREADVKGTLSGDAVD
jgi:hypothetical protein